MVRLAEGGLIGFWLSPSAAVQPSRRLMICVNHAHLERVSCPFPFGPTLLSGELGREMRATIIALALLAATPALAWENKHAVDPPSAGATQAWQNNKHAADPP